MAQVTNTIDISPRTEQALNRFLRIFDDAVKEMKRLNDMIESEVKDKPPKGD